MVEAIVNWQYFVMLMFVALMFLIFVGLPVGFSLMGVSLIFGYIGFGNAIGDLLIRKVWDVANVYILAAATLFVFMGSMLAASGIAKRLFEAMLLVTGRIRGGLAIGTVLMCTIFAASTGVIGASEVVIGLLAIPVLLSRNYNKGLICGTICAGGSLGAIIPPSVVTIIYGPIAGLSVGRLLAGTVFPGLMLSVLYILYILIRCAIRPQDGPGLTKDEMGMPWREKAKLVATSLLPPLALIFAVTGTILVGWAAPTEAAALGACGAILLCIIYKRMNLPTLKNACTNTIKIMGMIMLIMCGGTMYTAVFMGLGGAEMSEQMIAALDLSPWMTIYLFLGITLLAGFILDWISVLLILVPIFIPIITKLGFSPIWFSILFLTMMQTSFLTPPMAQAIFYLKGIVPPEIKTTDIFRGVTPYVGIQVIGIIMIIIFPEIATWLPEHLLGGSFK